MNIQETILSALSKGLSELYNTGDLTSGLKLEPTRKEFEGDFTFVVFPYLRFSKKSPEQTADDLGKFIMQNIDEIEAYNVIKGFLNVSLSDKFWINYAAEASGRSDFGSNRQGSGQKVMVEYSSPNTNKPLHLGHVRNNLLGYSISEILKVNGYEVMKVNLVNDRGIHICKSMLAWMRSDNRKDPATSGIKGDHLVGDYYVESDRIYRKQVSELIDNGTVPEEAEGKAPFLLEARELLKRWENGDKEVVEVWKMMNSWVMDGFRSTYKRMGVDFDHYYYESDTYLLGKDLVMEGISKGVLTRNDDGSVWIDLTDEGLDKKLLLRSDGTSVYMTQDLGTAQKKYEDFPYDRSIYVVGNEQEYHFKVLKLILKKLGKPYADGIYHFSYGMVDLPHGKMKTREGTVVDADELMDEMYRTAQKRTEEQGKTEGMSEDELSYLYEILGLGALKYYLLKVDPTKRILFNPEESIDFQGNTGTFIQYTHARISSLLRAAEPLNVGDLSELSEVSIHPIERELIVQISKFPEKIEEAGRLMSPAVVANYTYDLVRAFNHLYNELPVLKEADVAKRDIRIGLSELTVKILKRSCALLGMVLPERM